MASLTPLSKGLIALAVVGAMASAVWHLALKERFGAAATAPAATAPTQATQAAAPAPAEVPAPPPPPAPEPPAATAHSAETPSASAAENAEQGRKLLDSGDFARARPFLERAVQGGDGAAACHLGEMTLKGQGGISASQEKAAALFQLAQSRNVICFASGK